MKLTIDTKQRITSTFTFIIEFYKILMGTFLVTFVPQECDGNVCTMMENITNTNPLHFTANISNLITFLFVLNLYRNEILRENWCITYLDIDENKPNNNLDTQIEEYPEFKLKMNTLNNNYIISLYFALGFLIINFVLSTISIGFNYYGTNTITSLLSFIILVSSKILAAYNIGIESVENERALSAYLTTFKTYNVIDKDHIKDDDTLNKISIQEVTNENENDNDTPINEKDIKVVV